MKIEEIFYIIQQIKFINPYNIENDMLSCNSDETITNDEKDEDITITNDNDEYNDNSEKDEEK